MNVLDYFLAAATAFMAATVFLLAALQNLQGRRDFADAEYDRTLRGIERWIRDSMRGSAGPTHAPEADKRQGRPTVGGPDGV